MDKDNAAMRRSRAQVTHGVMDISRAPSSTEPTINHPFKHQSKFSLAGIGALSRRLVFLLQSPKQKREIDGNAESAKTGHQCHVVKVRGMVGNWEGKIKMVEAEKHKCSK